MRTLRGLSIRYKLLLLLTVMPVITLALYLFLATRLFEDDKIAYVFDSNAALSRSLASSARSELESIASELRSVAEGYSSESGEFDRIARSLFGKGHLDWVVILRPSPSGAYEAQGDLRKSSRPDDEPPPWESPESAQLIESARAHELAVRVEDWAESRGVLALRNGTPGDPDHWIALAGLRLPNLLADFRKGGRYVTYLVDRGGNVVAGPEAAPDFWVPEFKTWGYFSQLIRDNRPSGTTEAAVNRAGASRLLVSHAQVGVGDLLSVTLVEKKAALEAVAVLVRRSLLFAVALVSFAVLVSLIASNRLTRTLRSLVVATRRVAQGEFDVKVPIGTGDEVGKLASSFNQMAGEVARLMHENIAKARIEKELETAKLVQETLFPPSSATLGPLEVAGFYEPASECGGDWWHYAEIGGKALFWIGDVTGHGAAAALITSAAKSAASVIERLGINDPARAAEILNNAIFQTSKGRLVMTFFLATFDPATDELSYCNASHDPPLLLRPRASGALAKRDLIPLNEGNHPRLGQKADVAFTASRIKLQAGDALAFYTDGLTELENPQKAQWGERGFVKALLKAFSGTAGAKALTEEVDRERQSYRSGSPLKDDVTFFCVKYGNPVPPPAS